MPKLLCIDFDETTTKISFFQTLRFNKDSIIKRAIPGRQAAAQQTPQDLIDLRETINLLLDASDRGIKNKKELEGLIKTALSHGDCVAFTSYTDYPEAIELMLDRLALSLAERSSIYIACHLPFYGSHGEKVRFGEAEFDDSHGKDLHIQETLKHFQSKGKQIDKIILLDDNVKSIGIANQANHLIDGIPSTGILVDKSPLATPLYITAARELLELSPILVTAVRTSETNSLGISNPQPLLNQSASGQFSLASPGISSTNTKIFNPKL